MGMPDISIPNHLNDNHAYKDIYEQFVNEASFLWILRSISINEPHNTKDDLLSLEKRIDAQLDGLMTSIDTSWPACKEALDLQEPGEVFTAFIIAMRSHDANKIKQAVEVGLSSEMITKGLISAMGWLPKDIANNWIERFLNGKDKQHKYLGISACSVRRVDPGNVLLSILKRDDCIDEINLYARALRLVGELRRQDCMPYITNAINNDNELIKFWASWASVLLGQRSSIDSMKPFVFKSGHLQSKAIQLAFRVLPIETAREWISELSKDEKFIRTVIKSIGILGDPHAVNWLITKMKEPLYAKLAGESLTFITGIDLEKNNLNIDVPDTYHVIPNDDLSDDIIGLDEDENLPYPDVDKVMLIWKKYGQKFVVGKRYFMGQFMTQELLKERINNGTHRQRHAAAMELALLDTGTPLINTHARVVAA